MFDHKFKLLFVLLFLLVACNKPEISVEDSWIRSAPANSSVLAAFMKINNNTNKEVKLLSATVNGFKQVELHRTRNEGGMMKMIKQQFIPVGAKSSVMLKPGDWHIMLIGPEKVPTISQTVKIKLSFDNGQAIETSAAVKEGRSMMMGH